MKKITTRRHAATLLAALIAFAFQCTSASAEPSPGVRALAAKIIADQYRTIINCERCNLAGANFDGQFLRLAALQRADMRGASFREADMTGVHFNKANLEDTDFTGANLAGAVLLGANLRGADLTDARLDAVRVHDADFTGATLRRANLRMLEYVRNLTFAGADARDAIFRHSYLGRVDFTGADLSGADFTRAHGLENPQLARACGDERTILPPGLTIPQCKDGS